MIGNCKITESVAVVTDGRAVWFWEEGGICVIKKAIKWNVLSVGDGK